MDIFDSIREFYSLYNSFGPMWFKSAASFSPIAVYFISTILEDVRHFPSIALSLLVGFVCHFLVLHFALDRSSCVITADFMSSLELT